MKTEKLNLYDNRGDVTLTTYILDDSREMLNGKKRPAVLVCPGGAYLNCSDREGEPVALRFAAMGYHAFVLRYSVYGRNEPDFNAFDLSRTPVLNPDCVYPNPMRDLAKAMLTIRAHADEWLVDMDRVAICGFSFAVPGRTMPLFVVSSASTAQTTTRSAKGLIVIRNLL